MACSTLTVQQTDRKRLFLIRDSVKFLYDVDLIIVNDSDTNDNNSKADLDRNDLASKSSSSSVCNSCVRHDGHRASAIRPLSLLNKEVCETLVSVTLQFQTDDSQENIEKAKNFTEVHIVQSEGYIVKSYQLHNQEEFDMVLECSQEIQKSSSSLLTFNPDHLEVTLHGHKNNIVTATSKIIMILEKLRPEATSEDDRYTDNEYSNASQQGLFNLDKLLLQPVENDSGTSSSDVSAVQETTNCPLSALIEKSLPLTSNTSGTNNNQQRPLVPNKHEPQFHINQVKSHSSDDIEQDCCVSLNKNSFITANVDTLHKNSLRWQSSSTSSFPSSDDDSASEENILTNPSYSKQIEQALKLGYTESHVKEALVKLGPDCELNDLLSELIQIGASGIGADRDTASPTQNCSSASENHKPVWCEQNSGDYCLISGDADFRVPNCVPCSDATNSSNLRHIIIDGSNVAMSHGKKVFSCKGIKIAVDWFRERGHKNLTAFVPQWRKETSRPDAPISGQDILSELEKEGIVVFTPARRVKGRRVVCYDDRYILKLAVETDGIVVSNDVYRDLVNEREDFRKVVDQRLLMYSFVNDRFMPPEDPLGRLGPTLDNFLRKIPIEPSPKPQDCPYGKKCTYGNKCRFYHPERGFAPQKSITETLKEQADQKLQERASKMSEIAEKGKRPKQKLARTKSLVPVEPLHPFANSPSAESDFHSKKEKPRLNHSKSLVYPIKTSDYLSESRKKLEEAELAALEKMSVKKDPVVVQQQQPPETSSFGTTSVPVTLPNDLSYPLSSSPRSTFSPKDLSKQAGLPLDTTHSLTSPIRTIPSKSPRASPTHLTVPKSEPREGYVSGHLLLAKKLSDESKENNNHFFTEHTSSPTSTHTSSSVIPGKSMDLLAKDGQGEVSHHHIHRSLIQQHPYDAAQYSAQDTLPNLSIFGHGSFRYPLYETVDNTVYNRHPSTDSSRGSDHAHSPNMYPCSPDSGLFTGSEPVSSPYISQMEIPSMTSPGACKSYPVFKADQVQCPQEHQSLRRAFSSTGSVIPEDEYHKVGRRASTLVTPIAGGGDHSMLRSQPSMYVHKSSAFPAGFPLGLTRQNSTSDPQIHNIPSGGDFSDAFGPPSHFSAPSTTGKVQDPYITPHYPDPLSQMSSHQQTYLPQHFQSRQNYDNQQYRRLHQRQQNPHLLSPTLMATSTMGKWVESGGRQHLTHKSFQPGANTYIQDKPSHGLMSLPGQSQMSHMISSSGDQGMMTVGSLLSNSSHTPHYQQSASMYSAQYRPLPATSLSQNLRQSFPPCPSYLSSHQNHPLFGSTEQGNSVLPSVNYQSNQTSPSAYHMAPLMTRILSEDAPIVPEDPRYSLYYHLSNVFSEELVRKVMNQNPDKLDPDNLCNLIMKYKQETGN